MIHDFFKKQIFTKGKENKCFRIQIKSYVDFTTSHLPFISVLVAKPYSQTSMKMKSIRHEFLKIQSF